MSKENPNLKREIKTLKGETYPMSFPSQSDYELIKKEKGLEEKAVKDTDLPNESVQNVIINALSIYEVADRKEVFMLNQVAQYVMSEPDPEKGYGELKDKLFNFLVEKVLPHATRREIIDTDNPGNEKKKVAGVYMPWVIAQVYDELGVKEE